MVKSPYANQQSSGIVTNCDVVRGETVVPTKPQYVLTDIGRMWINLDIRHDDAAHVRTPELRTVTGILYIFLGNRRAGLIAAAGIPLCMLFAWPRIRAIRRGVAHVLRGKTEREKRGKRHCG